MLLDIRSQTSEDMALVKFSSCCMWLLIIFFREDEPVEKTPAPAL